MRRSATKLTEKHVGSLEWRSSNYTIWDKDTPGFGVRVWKGGKAYVVQLKVNGRARRKTLAHCGETTLVKARDEARLLKGAVRSGRDPFTEALVAREAWTLRDALDYFLGDYAARRQLDRQYKRNSEKLAQHKIPKVWWYRKLSDVTQDQIVRLHSEMAVTPRQANALLQLLSRLFSLGIEKGHCNRNPVKGIKRFDEPRRDRFLSDCEFADTIRALQVHKNIEAASCALLILATGCRPGEAYKAEWAHFELDQRLWRKPAKATKQRKPHIAYLNDLAIWALKRLDTAKRSTFVFPSPEDVRRPRQDIRGFWDRVRADLALPDVVIYSLRHTFASQLILMGAGSFQVKQALGHSTITTTERYVHLADEEQRRVVDMLLRKLPPTGQQQDANQVAQMVERKRNGAFSFWRPVPPGLFPE